MNKKTEEFKNEDLLETLAALTVLDAKENYRSDYEPFPQYAEKIRAQFIHNFKLGIETFAQGYETLIEELKKILPDEKSLKPYLLVDPMRVIERTKKPSQHMAVFENNFAYTDEMVKIIFQIIDQLQEKKEYVKSINLLSFLIFINPFIPNIWLHLGDIHKEQHNFQDALYDYLVAINSAPYHLEPYRRAINLCLESNQKETAQQVVEYGLKICEDHTPKSDEEKALPHQLLAILTYIKNK